MTQLYSYPKILNIGHKDLEGFLDHEVLVEEKIDGSQFSFGLIDGELKVRGKSKAFEIETPEALFTEACETVLSLKDKLIPGALYRCEYLRRPKHNALKYDRHPKKYLIIFDIDRGNQEFMNPDEKKEEADRLGLEIVPSFFKGKINSFEELKSFLDTESYLGGPKIEGIVIKNYEHGPHQRVLMAKYVSEYFKENYTRKPRLKKFPGKDIKDEIIEMFRTEARWRKAVQHLKESGELSNSPDDIGLLFKELSSDVKTECEDLIKEELFKWAWKDISKGISRGFAQWYKDELAKGQFERSPKNAKRLQKALERAESNQETPQSIEELRHEVNLEVKKT